MHDLCNRAVINFEDSQTLPVHTPATFYNLMQMNGRALRVNFACNIQASLAVIMQKIKFHPNTLCCSENICRREAIN